MVIQLMKRAADSTYISEMAMEIFSKLSHSYVKEDVLVPHSPLNILYVREIGLPVKSVPVLRNG